MQAISGLVVSGVVALVAAGATALMAERNRRTTDARAAEDLQISRASTLGSLVPHLASSDPRVREAALIAVDSLGHRDLFLRLAKAFGGEAAVGAVASSVLAGSDTEAEPVRRALTELVQLQARATFRVRPAGAQIVRATCFVAGEATLAVTTAHVVGVPTAPGRIGAEFVLESSNVAVMARVIWISDADDLAVLRTDGMVGMPPPLLPEVASVGSEVIRIHGDGRVDPGVILESPGSASMSSPPALITNIGARPGDSGAPVFDPVGRVVGMVRATQRGPDGEHLFTVLIPSPTIQRALRAATSPPVAY